MRRDVTRNPMIRHFGNRIPGLISTLPQKEELIALGAFPNLTSFLTDLVTRGLLEVNQENLVPFLVKKLKRLNSNPNRVYFRKGLD